MGDTNVQQKDTWTRVCKPKIKLAESNEPALTRAHTHTLLTPAILTLMHSVWACQLVTVWQACQTGLGSTVSELSGLSSVLPAMCTTRQSSTSHTDSIGAFYCMFTRFQSLCKSAFIEICVEIFAGYFRQYVSMAAVEKIRHLETRGHESTCN